MSHSGRIGLGTVQFGLPYGVSNRSGRTPPEEVSKILAFASGHGIGLIDTASAYGNAEKVLGQHDLSSFQLVSKWLPAEQGEKLDSRLARTLEDLRVDRLYGYLSHRPLSLLDDLSRWEELLSFRDQGLVEKIGFSLNTPGELTALLRAGCEPDLVQVPCNYVDRRFRDQMAGLKEKGCEIHARSVFLQGLFFKPAAELGVFFNEIKPLILSLQESVESLPGALLRFVLEQPFVDRVIVGVENCRQLAENLESLESSTVLQAPDLEFSEEILMPSRWPKGS